MEIEKYIALWKKYLPVIKIQLKKSSAKSQTLDMNRIEFESAGDRDLSAYTFNLEIQNGKVTNDISGSAVARDLFKVLTADKESNEFLSDKTVKINMGKAFKLTLDLLE